MGGGKWTSSDWSAYANTRKDTENVDISTDSYTKLFSRRSLDDLLNPLKIQVRESVESVDSPNPTPIIIALDQTGSMGNVMGDCLKQLNNFVTTLYDKSPVTDPQLCFMAVGDMTYNEHAPLQVTQFESDIRIAEQLDKLYIEGSGGGNDSETYIGPWYFAATKTKIDCFEKHNKKGWLITIGDEQCPELLKAGEIKKYIDSYYSGEDLTAEELLSMVSQYYNVFHVIVKEGYYAKYHFDEAKESWTRILGQKVIYLDKTGDLCDVLIATLQMFGAKMTKEEIIKDWDGSTALASIDTALQHLDGDKPNDGLVVL